MKALPPLARIAVVLSCTSHPGNIGAAARAMKTMGFHELRLVAPRHFPDPQASALAAGAADVLRDARVHATLEEALSDRVYCVGFSARARDLGPKPATVRVASGDIARAALEGGVALVFGNETFGLTNPELALCHAVATIPADRRHPSLNLAAAVQVACYEVALAAGAADAAPKAAKDAATVEDVDRLCARFEAAMMESGYLDPARPGKLMERLRRLLTRARLERAEAKALQGMLVAFERKMRRR